MAISANTTSSEQKGFLAQLDAPFDPREIKWRVTHTSRDGKKGAVIPFADPRAYTDRLNQLFTPAGWTREYKISTLSSLNRMKKDKLIQTGKILVTCVVTIHGLGNHSGSGEEWADEENAMTSAEAQAFKRACSCFGLGRYFYSFGEMWVPLNEYREPASLPKLPQWALPKGKVPSGKPTAAADPSVKADTQGPIDQKLTTKIESFRRLLGDPLYAEILKRAGHAQAASTIPNSNLQLEVVEWMERTARGIRKVHTLAETVGDTQFIQVLDDLKIEATNLIPSLEMLKKLVTTLEASANSQAA